MPQYSKRRIAQFIGDSDSAVTSNQKGDILEDFIKYLFEKFPGITFYAKNSLDGRIAQELDLIFWNMIRISDLCFLDPELIIECKNTEEPVGSNDVRWFIDKLRDRGIRHGILVSLNGITGAGTGNESAYSEVLNALTRDGIRILILNRDEILNLKNTDDLVRLLKTKFMRLTIDRIVE